MAERVDEIPARSDGKPLYPWDEWLDGTLWELVQGKDFQVRPNSMVNAAKTAAIKRGFWVRVVQRGDRVYIQAER